MDSDSRQRVVLRAIEINNATPAQSLEAIKAEARQDHLAGALCFGIQRAELAEIVADPSRLESMDANPNSLPGLLRQLRDEAGREAREDCRRIARGCRDYGGGYRGGHELEIYHHGMDTVERSIEASLAPAESLQLHMLRSFGAFEIEKEGKVKS